MWYFFERIKDFLSPTDLPDDLRRLLSVYRLDAVRVELDRRFAPEHGRDDFDLFLVVPPRLKHGFWPYCGFSENLHQKSHFSIEYP